jgi:hypothetical protein
LSYNPCLRLCQVSFLRYIRQWGKKVVFVLNKADLFESEVEVSCHRTSVAMTTSIFAFSKTPDAYCVELHGLSSSFAYHA